MYIANYPKICSIPLGLRKKWPSIYQSVKPLDYPGLTYTNLESPNIQRKAARIKLRGGKPLGKRVNGSTAVKYNIPGVSQQWESTGYMAQDSSQTALGRVFDQNNNAIDFSCERTSAEENRAKQIDYKGTKIVREQKRAGEWIVREESRGQKRLEKHARDNRNKVCNIQRPPCYSLSLTLVLLSGGNQEQRVPDADYEPSSPLASI